MTNTDATAMEIVTPSPKAPSASVFTVEVEEKFLRDIGTVLETLIREGAAPAPATARLLESAARIEPNYGPLLQSTMRKTALALVGDIASEQSTPNLHKRLDAALLIIDYALHLLQSAPPSVDATLPGALLEYYLSALSLSQINLALPALRSRMAAIGTGIFSANITPGERTRAKLELLKAALAVVKRDEAVAMPDPAFSGRLRFALAGALPVWDLSGANLKGARGAQGVQFADEAAFVAALKADLAARPTTPPVDFVLYRTFWALQDFLGAPFDGDIAARWPEAASVLARVLSALEKTPVAPPAAGAPADAPLRYLTAPTVFPSQLADADFRRTLCTQLLVCLLHLRLTGDEITQPRGDKTRWLPRHEFCKGLFASPDATGSVLHVRILALLRSDGGEDYAAHVEELLEAERFWTAWKTAGCANLERKRADVPKGRPFKRRRLSTAAGLRADGDTVGELKKPGMVPWTRRVKAFQVTKREAIMPILREKELPEIFSLDFIKAKLREDEKEEDVAMRHASDPKFEWLALRALRMNHLKGISIAAGDANAFDVSLARILTEEKATSAAAMETEKSKPTPAKLSVSKNADETVSKENDIDVKGKAEDAKSGNPPPVPEKESAKATPVKNGNGAAVEKASAEKVKEDAKKPVKTETLQSAVKKEPEVKAPTGPDVKSEAK